MRIITLTCKECNTIIAANELERERIMKCPGLNCGAIHQFEDLPETDREHVLDHIEKYRL